MGETNQPKYDFKNKKIEIIIKQNKKQLQQKITYGN